MSSDSRRIRLEPVHYGLFGMVCRLDDEVGEGESADGEEGFEGEDRLDEGITGNVAERVGEKRWILL